MKKLLIVFIILLSIFLCSCGGKYNVSDSVRKGAEKAVEIVDNFLDYDITIEDVAEQLQDICDLMISNKSHEDNIVCLEVENCKLTLENCILDDDKPSSIIKELLNERNKIAEAIGKIVRNNP